MCEFSSAPPDAFQYWHYEATLGAALLINARTGTKYRVYKVPNSGLDSYYAKMWRAVKI